MPEPRPTHHKRPNRAPDAPRPKPRNALAAEQRRGGVADVADRLGDLVASRLDGSRRARRRQSRPAGSRSSWCRRGRSSAGASRTARRAARPAGCEPPDAEDGVVAGVDAPTVGDVDPPRPPGAGDRPGGPADARRAGRRGARSPDRRSPRRKRGPLRRSGHPAGGGGGQAHARDRTSRRRLARTVNATSPVAKSSDTKAAAISDAALPAPASSPRLCSKEGTWHDPYSASSALCAENFSQLARRRSSIARRRDVRRGLSRPVRHKAWQGFQAGAPSAPPPRCRCAAGTPRGSARSRQARGSSANSTPGRNALRARHSGPGHQAHRHGLVDRRRVHGLRGRHGAVRIGHCPRAVPRLAVVTVAGDLTADTPHGVADRQRRARTGPAAPTRGIRAAMPRSTRRSPRRSRRRTRPARSR